MDKLPFETFIQVFSKLDLTCKLQCILVCKKWHDIISNTILYPNLDFSYGGYRKANQVDRFKKAFALFHQRCDGING